MANITAITSSGGYINVFVDSTTGFTIGQQAAFAGLTDSGSLAALLNGTSRTVIGIGSGLIQFFIMGAPVYPSGSGSDTETGTLTPLGNQQTIFLKFEDPAGNPIAFGRVEIWLTYDISSGLANGVQVAAGRKLNVALDADGTCIVNLYVNSQLKPSGSQYNAKAYTALGQPCWTGLFTVTATGENFLLQ